MAAAAASTSGGSTRQRASTAASRHLTGRRASPIGHGETVVLVRIMDSLDYDGDRGTYRNPNRHKNRIIAKVRSELMKQFSCDRTVKQLQKKWSDLKRQEKDRLREIREHIMKEAKLQRKRGRSRTTRRSSPPSPPPRPPSPPPPPQPIQAVSGTTTNPLQTVMDALVGLHIPELLRPLLTYPQQQSMEEEEKDDDESESDEAVPLDLSGSSPPAATPSSYQPDDVQVALRSVKEQIGVVQGNLINSLQTIHQTFLSLKDLETVIDSAMAANSLHFSAHGADA